MGIHIVILQNKQRKTSLKPQRVGVPIEFVQHKIVGNKMCSHTCPRYKWINSAWRYLPVFKTNKQMKTESRFQVMIYLTWQVQKWDANQGMVPSAAGPLGENWRCVKWKPGKSWVAVFKVQNVLECYLPLVSHCRSPSLTYVPPTSSRLYPSSTGTMRRSSAMTLMLTWTEMCNLNKVK